MTDQDQKEKFPSTFSIDNFSSTTQLASNEYKYPVSGSVDSIPEKDYIPYEHRQIEHPNTFFGALVHLLKSSLGTGILAIPSAFTQSGLVVGSIGTLLTGLICTHTIHLLVFASQEMSRISKTPSLDFSETAEAVFKYGPRRLQPLAGFAKIFVDISLVLTYYTGCAVYVVFICGSIQELVEYYHPSVSDWSIHYYMLMLVGPLIICCQVRELKHLVPFSFIANVTMLVAFAITLYYMFNGLGDIDISDRKLASSIDGFPIFFSTVMFAMEGIGTMLPIENSMLKQQFLGCPGVLNIAMTFVTILYTVFGIFGYIRFGDGVQANIIADLPEAEILAQVAKACITVAVFFTFMLQFYVPVNIAWNHLSPKIPSRFHQISQVLMRIILVVIITGIAAAVPKLNIIISLMGSIFLSILGLFIPSAIDIVLNMKGEFGVLLWRLWKDLLIIVISLFALFSGSYYAIKDLINSE